MTVVFNLYVPGDPMTIKLLRGLLRIRTIINNLSIKMPKVAALKVTLLSCFISSLKHAIMTNNCSPYSVTSGRLH